jgi:hypothetical protein
MKRIINRKVYDTEASKVIDETPWHNAKFLTLYRKKNNELFITEQDGSHVQIINDSEDNRNYFSKLLFAFNANRIPNESLDFHKIEH